MHGRAKGLPENRWVSHTSIGQKAILFLRQRLSSGAISITTSASPPITRSRVPVATLLNLLSPTVQPVSTGIRGQKGGRSAPSVINRAFSLAQFWDAATWEDQAKGPIANPIEMGRSLDAAVATLQRIPGYPPLFAKAFGDAQIDIDRVVRAIAL